MQPLSKLWRKPTIRHRLVGEQCIATCFGAIEKVKKRRAWGLRLIRHVRMPGDRVRPRLQCFRCSSVVRTSMYQMDFRVTRGCPTGRVDVKTTKVFAKLHRVFDWEVRKVLILEYCPESGVSLL